MNKLCFRDTFWNLQRCFGKVDYKILHIHACSHGVLDNGSLTSSGITTSLNHHWNASIQELIAGGKLEQALNHLDALQCNHVCLDRHTLQALLALLKVCGKLKCIERGQEVHAVITKAGRENDHFVGSALVHMYGKCGQLIEAQEVFNKVQSRNVVLWTSLTGAYTDHGHDAKALNCMKQMQLEGILPNPISFICSLRACGNMRAIDEGLGIHGEIVKLGFDKDLFVGSALVDAFSKCFILPEAQKVVDALPCVDAFTLTPLMVSYAENGFGEEAVKCWKKMLEDGICLDAVTLKCSSKACGSIKSLEWGREIHAEIAKRGLEIDLSLCNTLVDMYAKCGSLAEAKEVFDGLLVQDVVSWNTLLYGYAEHDLSLEVYKCLELMRLAGISPTEITCVCSLKACENIKMGKEIHLQINKVGFENNKFIASALVDMYAKFGLFAEALTLFYGLRERNTISLTALIGGYSDHNLGEEALHLLRKMVSQSVPVDAITFGRTLKVCGDKKAIARGREIHAIIVLEGLERDPGVGSMLVDMYATCGLLQDAGEMFNSLLSQSLASWTSLIAGYAKHGSVEAAINCLEMMQMENVPMDASAFACGLKVCGNMGSLHNGQKLHARIAREGLESDTLVGNILVDLYSKCGLLAEAQEVFDKLLITSTVSWTVLIMGYACQGENLYVFELFCRMKKEGIQPDKVTFLSLFTVCSHAGLVDEGQDYFIDMCRSYGISPIVDHLNCMLNLYSRAGQLEKVSFMLDKMPFQPDLSTWHTILSACRKGADVELGRHAFQSALMMDENLEVAFLLMLSIYAEADMWDDVKMIESMKMNISGF